MSYHLHHDCELHSRDDCGPAVWTVSARRDATYAEDYEINVGEDCVSDAEDHVHAQPGVVGLAQVDPLFYGVAA